MGRQLCYRAFAGACAELCNGAVSDVSILVSLDFTRGNCTNLHNMLPAWKSQTHGAEVNSHCMCGKCMQRVACVADLTHLPATIADALRNGRAEDAIPRADGSIQDTICCSHAHLSLIRLLRQAQRVSHLHASSLHPSCRLMDPI